jgi:hypothetical protein
MNRELADDFNKIYGSFFKEGIDAYLDGLELRLEKHFIDYLREVDIYASVKTNRHSLPYTKEIVVNAIVASYINEAFFHHTILRPAVKELLANDLHKIRFYIAADISESSIKYSGLPFDTFKMDSFTVKEYSIVYKFRYYPHS